MIKLYENIKTLRKENRWSQDELARKMGYTDRSMIAKIESGSVDLAESKIMAFAKVFGVNPKELMGWDQPAAPSSDPVAPVQLRSDESELLDKYNLLNAEGMKEIHNHADYIASQDRFLKDTSENIREVG